jgi:ABC-type transport system substrate-binding protein
MKLASTSTWAVSPDAVVEGAPEWKDQPIGAGPFKFVEWKRNEKIVLEAWEEFFLGRPTIDRVEYYIVPDANTRMAQYEAGELDVVGVPGADLQRVSADPVLSKELKTWPRAQLLYFGLNPVVMKEFQDVRVRQAIMYALDNAAVISQLLFNAHTPAVGIVPTGIPEHNPNVKGYTFQPDRARQLLAEAGYPDGKGFPEFAISTFGDETECEAFAAQLKQVLGLDVSVNALERGAMINGLWNHDAHQAFMWGWSADFPSAEVWTYQLLRSGLGSNFFNYSNPQFDAIVDQARFEMDVQKRTALWQQAEQLALEEAAIIPFGYAQHIMLVKPNVKGILYRTDGPYWYKDVTVER